MIIVIDIDAAKAFKAKKGIKRLIKEAGLTKALLVMKSADSMARQLTLEEMRAVAEVSVPKLTIPSAATDEGKVADLLFTAIVKKPRLAIFREL